jgi:hypothetical protein
LGSSEAGAVLGVHVQETPSITQIRPDATDTLSLIGWVLLNQMSVRLMCPEKLQIERLQLGRKLILNGNALPDTFSATACIKARIDRNIPTGCEDNVAWLCGLR